MILFLSASFLHRLQLIWKPALKAYLIGDRNLFFFTPDLAVEAEEISPSYIDAFLCEKPVNGNWQLLGFLAPSELPAFPGYVQLNTGGSWTQKDWKADFYRYEVNAPERHALEIRVGQP